MNVSGKRSTEKRKNGAMLVFRAVRRRRLLTICAIVLLLTSAWSIAVLWQFSRRSTVERALREKHVRFLFDYERTADSPPRWRIYLYQIPGGTAFARMTTIDAQMSEFGDSDVAVLRLVSEVRFLFLRDSKVTDEGLSQLPALPSLEDLNVPAVTSDDGLVCLERLPALQSLNLNDSRVLLSDRVVSLLTRLRSLNELHLSGVRLHSADELERLRTSHPHLKIYY